MKYRKKPVVIEAIEFTGKNKFEIAEWAIQHNGAKGVDFPQEDGEPIRIFTLEGTMTADVGDFIIRGVEGEFYPCKPGIFAKTYEAVPDQHIQSMEPTKCKHDGTTTCFDCF